MNALRHARFVATLLLSMQAFALAHVAGPAATTCTCTHGPEVNCGCAMHAKTAAVEPDESKLPPCHRHKAKASTPAAPTNGPCFVAGCAMPEAKLAFFTLLSLPKPLVVASSFVGSDRERAPPIIEPEAPTLSRIKPPPRASV